MSLDKKNLLDSFFLLILIMFSNYLYEIFPRGLDKLFKNNILIKHFLVFFLIFFTLELVDNNNVSPLENFYTSIIVYVFYILFTKSNVYFSLIIILLLATNFILIKEKEYLKNKGDDYKYLDESINILFYIVLVILFISSIVYLNKQLKEQKNFTIYKFIFSTPL